MKTQISEAAPEGACGHSLGAPGCLTGCVVQETPHKAPAALVSSPCCCIKPCQMGLCPHLIHRDCVLLRPEQHSLHRAVHAAQGTQGCLELLLLGCALLLGGGHCSQQLALSHQGSALVLGKSVTHDPEDLLDNLIGTHLRADMGPQSQHKERGLLPCLRQQPV